MHASFLIIFSALLYRFWYILFHVKSAYTKGSFHNVYVPLPLLVKTCLGSLVYQDMIAAHSLSLVLHICSYLFFSGIQNYALLGDYFTKKWNADTSEKILNFVKLNICLPYNLCTLSDVALWICPAHQNLQYITMSSAILKTFGILLNILSILWNISPTAATPNGNPIYLYLSKGQENVVQWVMNISCSID